MEGNVAYMEEGESNGSFLDTWARFPNIYDIYDTNDENAMTFMTLQTRRLTSDHYDMLGLNISSKKALM